jgi:hypothetical protein
MRFTGMSTTRSGRELASGAGVTAADVGAGAGVAIGG